MIKNYSLVFIAFLCFSLSGYGQTTVTYDFSASGATTSGALDSNIGFTTAKNSGTATPTINSGQLRLYQNGTKGGSIIITPLNGVIITEVIVNASGTTGPAGYNVDGSFVSNLSTSTIYTMSGLSAATDVEFFQRDTSSSNRIYVDNFEVTYESASADTELNFASTTYSTSEGGSSINLCVDITNPSATPTTANVVLTSSSSPHLSFTSQAITFASGSSVSQCVSIPITNNGSCGDDTDYTFKIQNVSGGSSASVGTVNETILSVNDDDGTSGAFKTLSFETGDDWGYSGTGQLENDFNKYNGTMSYEMNDNESIELDNVSLTGYTNVTLSVAYAATNVDSGDDLYLEISYDGGSTYTRTKLIDGTSDYDLNINSTGSVTRNPVQANPYIVNIPPTETQIRVRFSDHYADASDYYYVDDIILSGDACLCSAPADPTGSITGTTPACTSTDLTYTGTAAPGTTNYWQTSPTGTATTDNATGTYTVTTTGTYYVRAYDTAGTCWSDGNLSYAVIIENGVPTLTQPTNQTEVIPDTATFSVSSSDTDTYQWQVSTNGGATWTNVSGGTGATTDTYTTGVTSASMDDNQYRCILTNICGATTSNAATLNLTNEAPNNVRNIQGCFEDTSVTLNWDAPASGVTPTGYMVFARDGGTDPTGTKTDANTYTANTNFAAATSVTPASLGRVVYKGTATTATITGLIEDNNYSFTVYAYVGETLTGWANGGTTGSTVTNGLAQGDITNLTATPLTNQVNLNWNNPLPTACWDQLIIVANQGGVTFTPSGDGSAYTGNDNDVYTTPNQLVYETTSSTSSKSITGLTNGTNYCFKIFIRRGTTWTTGIEVCATPSLTYCDSYGNGSDGWLTLINNVKFNTIDNTSPNIDNDYTDFTAISTTVTIGQTYNLDVRVNTGGTYTTVTRAWIDWNNDGDFSDANEVYELGNAYDVVDGSTDGSPLSIEVPSNAVIAATRMRISTKFGSTPSTPCQTTFDGEVEDYTINIQQPVNAEINVKGNNISIANGFNAPYGLNNTLYASTDVGSTGPEKSYIIENIGATALNLTGTPKVEIIGTHASDFIVTLQPSTSISSGSNSEFRIEFNPTSDGVRKAKVSIENSDSDEDPYIFDIEGSAVCSTVLTSSIWPTEGPENTEITITSANNLTGAIASINGLAMTTVTASASELVVLLPAGATSGDITVLFSTGCSSANAFTVLNDDITSCETTSASTPPTDLFISQISDATTGSSSLVEIFNGTASTVNLSNYSIRVFNNGNGSPSSTLNLTGTVVSGGVHVISIGTSSCDFSAAGLDGSLPHQAFDTASGINFDNNSSDLIELYNHTTSTSIDVFGVFGSDNWANGLGAGDNGINFSRLNTASMLPTTTFDLADWDITDWITCSDSDYSDFGVYDFALATPPTVSVLAPPVFNCTNSIQISVIATEGVPSGLGLTYQWFYLEPGTATFVAVPNNADFDNVTTAILDIINPLSYLDYQFYCQVREDVATCYKASNAVKLEAITAVWDGTTWSTAPASNKFVIIDGDYDTGLGGAQTSFEACSCTITIDNELIINDNTYVLAENNLIVDGKLTLKPYGSFVQINDAGTTSGNVLTDRTKIQVIKKTAMLASRHEYTYWSSPVSGEQISNGLAEANPGRIYSYSGQNYLDATTETNNDNTTVAGQDDIDDDANDWVYENGTTIMEPGVGYAATQNSFALFPTQIDYVFEGPFNNGVYNIPIYRNDSELNDNNWNLIGNPYPSAISADLFLAENASIGQNIGATNGAIFFWSHNTDADGATNGNENLNYAQSDYAIINGSGQTMGGDGLMPTRYIPSGQAFFIAMDNASPATVVSGDIKQTTILFNNSMRVTANNNQFFRSTNTATPNKLWLNLETDNGAFNQILVAYVNGATDEDDGMYYDTQRNLSTETNTIIYSLIDEDVTKKFAIQGKNPNSLTLDEVIPLGFNTSITAPTIYRISIYQFEGDFMSDNPIYINDKLLNTTHNLKDSDYTFTSETGEFKDRFEIVFTPTILLSIDDNIVDANEVKITELQNGNVEIKVGNTHTIKHVAIIDVTGRLIYSLQGHNAIEVYNLSKLSQAAYIAKVTLSNGQVISKKAIKRH
ncbi:GEVED domain-containing protein [Winogradskyella sp. PC D3.3]